MWRCWFKHNYGAWSDWLYALEPGKYYYIDTINMDRKLFDLPLRVRRCSRCLKYQGSYLPLFFI